MNDRSNEALLAHRAIAEKAAPYGPVLLPPSPCEDSWHVRNDSDTKVIRCYGFGNNGKGEAARHLALYIAATPPETVIADIDEILRLRTLVQEHEEYIANLEFEAASTDNKIDGLAVLLGITPDTGNRRIIGIIKDEILRLRAEAERLNKEADYLAGVIAAAYCAQKNVTHCEKTEGLPLHKLRDACATCWREAAHKAVEEKA